jgi:hypothetical protein
MADMALPLVSPDIDQQLVLEEMRADPSFGKRIASMLRVPGGERLITLSAQKAIANEFDPKMYPATRGEWQNLRKRAVEMARALPEIVEKEIDRLPFETKMRWVHTIAAGGRPEIQVGVRGMGDLGQFEIIGSIVSAIAGAGGSIYSAKVTASAQKDIAQIQAQTAMKDIQAQTAIANAQQAIAKAQAVQATAAAKSTVAGALTADIGGGIPLWVLPMALGVVGLVLYFVFRKG